MKIRKVQAFGAMLCASVVATAGADIIFDNIGAMDGSNMVGNMGASQYFEANFAQYDIATIDDFSFDGGTLDSVSFVLGGWNGYAGSEGVTGYQVNVYSLVENAGVSLIGDVLSMDFATATESLLWSNPGGGEHMTIDLGGVALGAGDYYISVIAYNEYGLNGQTGMLTSNLGGDNGYQANPGGGFGFGGYTFTGANYAYALDGSAIPGPAAFCLLGIAGVTIRRRRR